MYTLDDGAFRASLGGVEDACGRALAQLAGDDVPRRLAAKDPTLFKGDVRAVADRLGWLSIVPPMLEKVGEIRQLAESARKDGFRHAVLLGMGGSSLSAEVFRRTFGVAPGFLDLEVLDSTDPRAIRAAEARIDRARTLFIVASKSGTTPEIAALQRYFASRVANPRQLVAITDPGTVLESQAKTAGYRQAFLNPHDIGGRYSALSYFGLVPAALIGVDIARLLGEASLRAAAWAGTHDPRQHSAVLLGACLAASAREGRDKLTLLIAPEMAHLGGWIEQLVAESTGKEGKGIVPIVDEPLGPASSYGPDRIFVRIGRAGASAKPEERALADIERAGHPVVRIELRDLHDLGAEFFRWEVATAIAGSLLGVNPFDEPNVKESKDLTRDLLQAFKTGKKPAEERPAVSQGPIRVYADPGLAAPAPGAGVAGWVGAHLARAKPQEFVGWLLFIAPSDAIVRRVSALREVARKRTGLATVAGFGPRFLHSTGQLFKGGANRGLFFQVTFDPAPDIEIPGDGYGFATLIDAQATGDLLALRRNGRRVLRCHVAGDPVAGLEALEKHVASALAKA